MATIKDKLDQFASLEELLNQMDAEIQKSASEVVGQTPPPADKDDDDKKAPKNPTSPKQPLAPGAETEQVSQVTKEMVAEGEANKGPTAENFDEKPEKDDAKSTTEDELPPKKLNPDNLVGDSDTLSKVEEFEATMEQKRAGLIQKAAAALALLETELIEKSAAAPSDDFTVDDLVALALGNKIAEYHVEALKQAGVPEDKAVDAVIQQAAEDPEALLQPEVVQAAQQDLVNELDEEEDVSPEEIAAALDEAGVPAEVVEEMANVVDQLQAEGHTPEEISDAVGDLITEVANEESAPEQVLAADSTAEENKTSGDNRSRIAAVLQRFSN